MRKILDVISRDYQDRVIGWDSANAPGMTMPPQYFVTLISALAAIATPLQTTRRDSDLPTVMPSSKKHEPVFKTKQPASSPDESAHTATDAAHICNESLALLRYGTFSGS